jgi:hypothetical protein
MSFLVTTRSTACQRATRRRQCHEFAPFAASRRRIVKYLSTTIDGSASDPKRYLRHLIGLLL